MGLGVSGFAVARGILGITHVNGVKYEVVYSDYKKQRQ
jgi:hypothetical protein